MISLYLLSLLISLSRVQCSLAAPRSNNTNLPSVQSSPEFVGYIDDPNGRGTASLIISCLLTLLLCVWSALHLNVPQQNQTILGCFFINLRWIVAGVYAPELVVFTAWRQWSSARILSNLIQNLRANRQESGVEAKQSTTYRHGWTMTHSFFASTGGFVFEIEDEGSQASGPFLPTGCPRRLTLTACGMALLARCGHLPDLPKAEITDKSKANDIAKALVLIQASWMLIQVVGRLIARLPVTLLEVNTIAHVVCAFLMYAMWWHKPLAPDEPFVLRGDWVNSLCAYMYMSSEISGAVDKKAIESQTRVKTLLASLHLYSRMPEMESMSFLQASQNNKAVAPDRASDASSITIFTSMPDGEIGEAEPGIDFEGADRWPLPTQALNPSSRSCLVELRSKKLRKTAGTAFFERRPRIKGVDSSPNVISQASINRWTLASSAIETYPTIQEHYLFRSHHQGQCLHFKSEELLVERVQNWPWDDLLRNVGGLVVGVVLWLACFTYGAIHLSAWNDHFPTVVEQWLWRSSSLYVGFCGGLWIILNSITQAYAPLNSFWDSWMDGGGKWWQNLLLGVPVVACGLALIFARAFIVIEAFLSIRELPAGAYETPTWTQVFPHF